MIRDPASFQILLDTIARFVREKLIPREREVSEADEIPADIAAEMRRMGLFGLTIPEEYGGLGLTTEEEALTSMALCEASPVFRSYMGTNNGIGGMGIVIDGTDAQKKKYLPRLATGEIIGSFALTEPGSGSDAGALTTRAEKHGDYYIVNGAKRYITNAPEASIFTLMARTDPNSKDARGVSAFIVERDSPGLTVGKPDRKMGQRGSHTADVIFENVRVPAENVIGGVEGMGFKTAMKVLDRARLNIASVCTGIAQRCLNEALAYAKERRQFGKAIADFQGVQFQIARMATDVEQARLLVYNAARLRDARKPFLTEAAMCKLDRKSTRLNSSHTDISRMPSSA